MNKTLLSALLLAFAIVPLRSSAWHIVGGEIELLHIPNSSRPFQYILNLIQYFDASQSRNVRPDRYVTLVFYKNGSDVVLKRERIPRVDISPVSYTSPACAIGELVTRRLLYSKVITLDPSLFSDQAGYYIVWERCCRNSGIVNIDRPAIAGITYVLEFPPIVKDGDPFINSSPRLFPPLSDYACVNQLFYADFAGTDDDGDELVYSLVTPRDWFDAGILPTRYNNSPNPSRPKPFKEVALNELGLNGMIPGDPSLQITDKGFLTVKPSQVGLYVFSVRVEEYRDKVKIGEVTRDFQMLVVDGCNPPDPPQAMVRLPGEKKFYNEVDVIKFTVADEKCFEFLVTDGVGEQVTFEAEAVNFTGPVVGIFAFEQGFINANKDTLKVEVCIPDCPYLRGEPFIIDLLAKDNACPLPQIDTVKLTILVEPPPNDAPYFNAANKRRTVVIDEGEQFSEYFSGLDADGDRVTTTLLPAGFVPADFGMTMTLGKDEAGENEVLFEWDAQCFSYDFDKQSEFEAKLVLEDLDRCSQPAADTLFMDLEVIIPPNTDPIISTGIPSPSRKLVSTSALIGNTVEFNVKVEDGDGDLVHLSAAAPEQMGLDFPPAKGTGQLDATFSWHLDCQTLGIDKSTSFKVLLIAEDEDVCKLPNRDTVEVDLNVIVPVNHKPVFDAYGDYTLTVNQPFQLDITAGDADNDFLILDLLGGRETPPSESFSFGRVSGQGSVSSRLEWTPECSLLADGFSPMQYPVFFTVSDGRCPVQGYDTMSITFEIRELDVDYNNFLPANVFTPNGDNRNDTFKLTNLPIPEQNLPADNCQDRFLSIVIVNRNGKTVFESEDRDFEWTGGNLPAAAYYYYIDYKFNDYRGVISIMY